LAQLLGQHGGFLTSEGVVGEGPDHVVELRPRPQGRPASSDNSVSSCRSYSRAKGPRTSAGAFPKWRCPYLERVRGVLHDDVPRGHVGSQGPLELSAPRPTSRSARRASRSGRRGPPRRTCCWGRTRQRTRTRGAPARLAMGGKVIFMPPCLFCMENHY
jgi:hypothetical protein